MRKFLAEEPPTYLAIRMTFFNLTIWRNELEFLSPFIKQKAVFYRFPGAIQFYDFSIHRNKTLESIQLDERFNYRFVFNEFALTFWLHLYNFFSLIFFISFHASLTHAINRNMDHGWNVPHAKSSLTLVVLPCWWSVRNWRASRRFEMSECVNIASKHELIIIGFIGGQKKENVNSAERSVWVKIFVHFSG